MYWGISIAIPLIALTCYGALLFITARQGLERTVNRFFALYLLSMLVWSFGTFMMRVAADDVLFWNKVMLGGLMGMPLAFFGFVRVFLMIKGQRRWLYLGLLLYTILLIANGMGYVSEYVHMLEEGVVEFRFGPAVPVLGVYFVFLLAFSALNLMRGYRRARDSVQSNRIRYALLGLSAIVLGSITNLVPALGGYPIDIAANVVNACLIAYAIFRYQLLEITVVFRRGLLYSVPMTMIGIFYFIAISLAVQVFHVFVGYQIFILSFLIAVVTAVVAQPLWDSAQLWIDKLFFREKYDAYLMLQKLSREVASIIHLEDLLNMVLEELAARMHIAGIGAYLKGGMGDFRLAAQTGRYKNPAHLSLGKDHPVVHWLVRKGDVLTRHEIGVLPHFQALWGEETEELERLGLELFVPLKAKGELVGILAVGRKLSDEAYSQDDQLTLSALANQTAVAIENARLYEEAQQEIRNRKRVEEEIKERNRELAALNAIATTMMQSALDLDEVLQRTADGVVEGLGCNTASIFLLDKEEEIFKGGAVSTKDKMLERMNAVIGFPLLQIKIPARRDFNEAMSNLLDGRPTIKHDFYELVRPLWSKPVAYAMQRLLDSRTFFTMPLVARGKTVGGIVASTREELGEGETEKLMTFANQAAIAIENARLYETAQRELAERKRAQEELRQSYVNLQKALEGTVNVLVSAIEMRDPYTGGHQRRVTQLACAIAEEMGFSEEQIEGVRMAGLIHDVGKINVPAEILSKPGQLTELEFGLIKMHPQIGYDVLKAIEFPWPLAQIVLQHHERMDGSGYPQGLSGEEIMLEARILAVADVVEAMASHRPYRPSRGIDLALEEISQNRGVLYDPEVVDVCLKLFTEKGFKLE
ncbi:MAG: HD domain-containing phosphohydrolase [Anaerolineae bacterium]